jgi:predicted PurR-regulated permease PerM
VRSTSRVPLTRTPAADLPADDTLQDVQRRGIARWSPRRAGVPALQDWWPAYFLLATAAVLAVLVTARLAVDTLAPFAHVIVVAGVAAVVTFALAPLVGRLEQRMPRRAAAALVFFGTLLCILGIAGVVVWQLSTEGERFTEQIDELTAMLQGRRPLAIGPYPVPLSLQERVRDLVITQGPSIAERTAGLAGGIISSLIDLVLVLVVTFYFLLDARRFRLLALRWLEPAKRPAARRVFSEVAHVFGSYVRAQLTVAISLGVLVATAMFLLGVPYALFLALFAALVELIPMLGPIIGAVPAVLIALTLPFPTVLWVVLAFLVIQQIEQNFLLPRLSAHAVGIHPIGSILALVFGFEVGGVIGALFAVPITGLIWVLVSTAFDAWRGRRVELARAIEEKTLTHTDGRPAVARPVRHSRTR